MYGDLYMFRKPGAPVALKYRPVFVHLFCVVFLILFCTTSFAASSPYERFMSVESWKLKWSVVWSAYGQDTFGDGIRDYDYGATSSGIVEMEAEDPYNRYFRTWRAPDTSGIQGGIDYKEVITSTDGRERTTTYASNGLGNFESIPFAIDADKGTYNFSIPDVVFENTLLTITDGTNTVEETLPYIVLSWPTDDPTFLATTCSQIPLPAEGLTITGGYSFTCPMPTGSVYIPEGVVCTVSYTYTPGDEKLEAKPNVAETIERGETVELDGSESTGDIKSYEWSFKSLAPGEPQPDTQVKLEGETATVVLLKSMRVTLTVSDGKKKDKKTVVVQVQPRSWELPIEQIAEEGLLPDGMGGKPYYREGSDISYSGGENVCALDPPADDTEEPHIIHPKKDAAESWDSNGYELAQVTDGGPFDGWWYVQETTIEVKRQILLNKYILPGGPVIFSGMEENFYTANVSREKDVDGYLAAARAHESDHTTKMKQGLGAYDPAKKIEKLTARSRDDLKKKADAAIEKAEDMMSRATSDCRMPVTWRGELVAPDDATYIWTPVPFQVGGAPEGCR